MSFLNVEEYQEILQGRKSNCLGFALSVTEFDSILDIQLDHTKPLRSAFKEKCEKFGVKIIKEIEDYSEILETHSTIVGVWGFYYVNHLLYGIIKCDFHVARLDLDGKWYEIHEYGGKPCETSWSKLIKDYQEFPLLFEIEKC